MLRGGEADQVSWSIGPAYASRQNVVPLAVGLPARGKRLRRQNKRPVLLAIFGAGGLYTSEVEPV